MMTTTEQKGKVFAWLISSGAALLALSVPIFMFSLMPHGPIVFVYMLAPVAAIIFLFSAVRFIYLLVKR